MLTNLCSQLSWPYIPISVFCYPWTLFALIQMNMYLAHRQHAEVRYVPTHYAYVHPGMYANPQRVYGHPQHQFSAHPVHPHPVMHPGHWYVPREEAGYREAAWERQASRRAAERRDRSASAKGHTRRSPRCRDRSVSVKGRDNTRHPPRNPVDFVKSKKSVSGAERVSTPVVGPGSRKRRLTEKETIGDIVEERWTTPTDSGKRQRLPPVDWRRGERYIRAPDGTVIGKTGFRNLVVDDTLGLASHVKPRLPLPRTSNF